VFKDMWQIILICIVFILVIVFGAQNMHQARVNLPLTGTVEIRTVFLLLLCFFLGYAAAFFSWLLLRAKGRGKK